MGTVTEMQAERAMVWKERDKAIEAERAAKQALKEAEQALQREKDNGSGKMWVAELGEARDRITELVAGAKTYLRERDEARQKRDDLIKERDQAYKESLEAKNHALREGAALQGQKHTHLSPDPDPAPFTEPSRSLKARSRRSRGKSTKPNAAPKTSGPEI